MLFFRKLLNFLTILIGFSNNTEVPGKFLDVVKCWIIFWAGLRD